MPTNDDDARDETSADDPPIVGRQGEPAKGDALWSGHDGPDARAKVEEALEGVQGAGGTGEPQGASAGDTSDAEDAGDARDADDSGVRERAGAAAGAAGEFASAQAAKAGERASEARDKLGAKAGETRDKAGAKASAFAASARERAANADVKELAANTTSLIDTARPFFLAAFAVVFTILGFVEGDSGTSQWFVVGAILFVLAAGFSDELGHLMPRRRREGDE